MNILGQVNAKQLMHIFAVTFLPALATALVAGLQAIQVSAPVIFNNPAISSLVVGAIGFLIMAITGLTTGTRVPVPLPPPSPPAK